jgi:hypothetical protein
MARQPLGGLDRLIFRGFTITHFLDTPHSVGLLWTRDKLSQRPLPDNKQHSQETDIHALGGIQTHNPSKRVAVDPRLRPRGQWDQHYVLYKLKLSHCRKICNPLNIKNISYIGRRHVCDLST